MEPLTSQTITKGFESLGGKGSKRQLVRALRILGYDIDQDELAFHMNTLLRTGKIRPMIGEESKLDEVYELQRLGEVEQS